MIIELHCFTCGHHESIHFDDYLAMCLACPDCGAEMEEDVDPTPVDPPCAIRRANGGHL